MSRRIPPVLVLGLIIGFIPDTPRAQPIAPFVEFLGQRFAISDAGISASGGIAFRASDETILTEHHTELCGAPASFAVGDQGVAVDPLTDRFWYVNNTGVIREVVSEDPVAAQIVFAIPDTFDVPGVGPSSVYSVRGLALDDTYVYVVDAGPDLGAQTSNQWFKFTRDGVPVSSSALTDFTDHLDFGLDAVVDGIHRIPDLAPYGAGLFLVAVEHSGILVIDENGFFLDRLSWEDAALPIGAVPFAFSGITMDPVRGDLYIVENSGSQCHVWNRLPGAPTPVLYATSSGLAEIDAPGIACARRLNTALPTDPVFAMAYRPDTGVLMAVSYNTGEVYAMDPRSGQSSTSGTTIVNVWGFAWDGTRGIFHANRQGQLYHVDPSTFDATPLPEPAIYAFTDITYSPADDALYAVAYVPNRTDGGVGTDYLVRLDPVSGAATLVGPTVSGDGIAYDPIDGRLLVVHREGGTNDVYAIDPSTGTATLLEAYGPLAVWEALEVIPSGETVVHTENAALPEWLPPARVRAVPNPTRGALHVEVGDGIGRLRRADVFDAAGRRVRALRPRGRDTGLRWDGRDESGHTIAPGVYQVRVEGAAGRANGRVVVIR